MKNQSSESGENQKTLMVCDWNFIDADGKVQNKLVEYDLSPLRVLIENGELEDLIDKFEEMHSQITEACLKSNKASQEEKLLDGSSLLDGLSILRNTITAFREVRDSIYEMKNLPPTDLNRLNGPWQFN